ncbi:MAG TPA: Nif3-like dinuclear metal center hexameric protein [Flavipsychrobacter sp.]|nr:Nif3-like dinuclear metal center hexameric protein [Flavipsychrobacter sp.]
MPTVKDIMKVLDAFAPLQYQESYDNSGLQVGNSNSPVSGVLVSLDVTEAILDEAMQRGCNMIVAHHPLLFSGLKSISGKNYIERIVIKAIKHDIAIYAIHTNLDNMKQGVNAKIAEKLGLRKVKILSASTGNLSKLYTYVPLHHADAVKEALFTAGAGHIGNYSECSFSATGTGTFKPGKNTNPSIGTSGGAREAVEEVKLEVLIPLDKKSAVLAALQAAHPYEEVAYELIDLRNTNQDIGAGMIGHLETPMKPGQFLTYLKTQMKLDCIRHTELCGKEIRTVAVCGGSGSFLLNHAIAAKADVFVTADFKYHQFFDADGQIIIADIGHYESEQFTIELIADILNEKFINFAVLLTDLSTNPVKYFC